MKSVEKAAVLLRYLGEDAAAKVLSKFNDEEIRKITPIMCGMKAVTAAMMDEAIKEFTDLVSKGKGILSGGDDYTRTIISKALGVNKANSILSKVASHLKEDGLETLRRLDANTVVSFCKGEHPQTIALILAHLDPNVAGDVISKLPEGLQSDVMIRLCNLEGVSPEVIEEIASVINSELRKISAVERKLGGMKLAAEILNQAGRATEARILSMIEEQDPSLSSQIKDLMFVFEDLISIDDRGIQQILKEITTQDLGKALKTASEELKEKIFKNMSERAAEMLKEDMEVMGPMRLSDVEKAQQSVARVAIRLQEEGKITIGSRGGEDVLV